MLLPCKQQLAPVLATKWGVCTNCTSKGSWAQGSSPGCCPQDEDGWMRVLGWEAFPNELLRGVCISGGSSSCIPGWGCREPPQWLCPEEISACPSILNAPSSHCTGPWTLHLCLPGKEKFLQNPPCYWLSLGQVPASGSPKADCFRGIVPGPPEE